MQVANKLMMISISVADMPQSKDFYVDKLGFAITKEYRKNDNNWWVTLSLPDGGTVVTLSRASFAPQSVAPDTLTMYSEASDIEETHAELNEKGLAVSEIQDNLFGPGSRVKWCNVADPDGNRVFFAQKHNPRKPF